jgi:hypothetical protein
MQTYSGRQFWPLDPRSEDLDVLDIAHALSNQCRYAGHCRRFYSVAQHSVLVSRIVPLKHARWGLLHDATEAYLVDLPRPIKRYSALGDEYRRIEDVLMAVICSRFRMLPMEPKCVKEADDIALMTEKRDLMPGLLKWRETAEPLPDIIVPMAPECAKTQFLARAEELRIR